MSREKSIRILKQKVTEIYQIKKSKHTIFSSKLQPKRIYIAEYIMRKSEAKRKANCQNLYTRTQKLATTQQIHIAQQI